MDFLNFLPLYSKPNIGRMFARSQEALAAPLIQTQLRQFENVLGHKKQSSGKSAKLENTIC